MKGNRAGDFHTLTEHKQADVQSSVLQFHTIRAATKKGEGHHRRQTRISSIYYESTIWFKEINYKTILLRVTLSDNNNSDNSNNNNNNK
jgi:hypothetical protein